MSFTRPEYLAFIRALAINERMAKHQLDSALHDAYAAGLSARRLAKATGYHHTTIMSRIERYERDDPNRRPPGDKQPPQPLRRDQQHGTTATR